MGPTAAEPAAAVERGIEGFACGGGGPRRPGSGPGWPAAAEGGCGPAGPGGLVGSRDGFVVDISESVDEEGGRVVLGAKSSSDFSTLPRRIERVTR